MDNEMMGIIEGFERKVAQELVPLTQKQTLSPTEIKAGMDAACLLLKLEMLKNGNGDYEPDEMSYMSRGMNDWEHSGWMRSPVTGRYVSRGNGYSGHSVNDKMIAKLEMAYDDAASQYEREEIRKEIDHLRNRSN